MNKSKRNKLIVIIGGITLLFAVLIVISSSPSSPIHGVYKVFASPVSVVQETFSSWGRQLKDGFDMLFHADEINRELEQLRSDNAALNDILTRNEILERQNEDLKGMLEFKEKYTEFDVVGAEVIAGDVS